MSKQFDVVVVGAGHNPLIAAAYMAKAGLSVLVLEKNSWIGGGVVTRELTLPGFKHDPHSTVHNLIQANPLIMKDELGLKSKFGLDYIRPEVSFASVYDDGTSLLTYYDLDKTCESIAQFSRRDAEVYRAHIGRVSKLIPMFANGLFMPPAPFGTFLAMLEQSPEGRDLMGVMHKSAFDIIDGLFESDKAKIHFLKISSEAMSGPEEKGTGLVFNMLTGFLHTYQGAFPRGGSGALTDALAACLQSYGAEIRTDSDVRRILVEGGKAQGVELASGEKIMAKRAVIASIHPHVLGEYVEGLDERLIANAKDTQHSGYSSINSHYALNEAPRYKAMQGLPPAALVECLPARMEDFRTEFDDLRYGRLPKHPSLVCGTHTNFDPSRAPAGKATLYLYSFAPYELAEGGAASWDEVKEQVADSLLETFRKYTDNMDASNILARHVESPLDYERTSRTFRRGDISGIGRYLNQFLGRRPTPELAQYAVPGATGLYLSGPFMHPGGGVIGGGRPTARKIAGDLGINFDQLVAS